MSKKVKSDGSTKIMAEVDDISCWPVATTGRAFKPGTRYNLGSLASLAYTLVDGKDGSEWYFTFESPSSPTTVTHPKDVKLYDFEIEANSHVEVSIMQFGTGDTARKELVGICKEITQ